MPTYAILDSYTLVELRKEIELVQLKGYSRMTKPELIDLIMAHKSLFQHLKGKTGNNLVDKGVGLTVAILKTYSVGELRKEVGKKLISGYNKASKEDVIKIIMENKQRFHHLKGKGVEQPPEPVVSDEDDEIDEDYEKLSKGEQEEVDALNFIFPIAEANRLRRKEQGIPEQDQDGPYISIDQEEEREAEGYREWKTDWDQVYNYNIYTKEAFDMFGQRIGDWDPKTSTIILTNGDRLLKTETEEEYYAGVRQEQEDEDEAVEEILREKEKSLRIVLRPSVNFEENVTRMMEIYRRTTLRESMSERMESNV